MKIEKHLFIASQPNMIKDMIRSVFENVEDVPELSYRANSYVNLALVVVDKTSDQPTIIVNGRSADEAYNIYCVTQDYNFMEDKFTLEKFTNFMSDDVTVHMITRKTSISEMLSYGFSTYYISDLIAKTFGCKLSTGTYFDGRHTYYSSIITPQDTLKFSKSGKNFALLLKSAEKFIIPFMKAFPVAKNFIREDILDTTLEVNWGGMLRSNGWVSNLTVFEVEGIVSESLTTMSKYLEALYPENSDEEMVECMDKAYKNMVEATFYGIAGTSLKQDVLLLNHSLVKNETFAKYIIDRNVELFLNSPNSFAYLNKFCERIRRSATADLKVVSFGEPDGKVRLVKHVTANYGDKLTKKITKILNKNKNNKKAPNVLRVLARFFVDSVNWTEIDESLLESSFEKDYEIGKYTVNQSSTADTPYSELIKNNLGTNPFKYFMNGVHNPGIVLMMINVGNEEIIKENLNALGSSMFKWICEKYSSTGRHDYNHSMVTCETMVQVYSVENWKLVLKEILKHVDDDGRLLAYKKFYYFCREANLLSVLEDLDEAKSNTKYKKAKLEIALN